MMRTWTIFAGGVALGATLTAAALTMGPAVRAEAAVAQGGVKYQSKVVLENDLVRVKDVTFPAGVADTGMHTHDLPHVGVIITDGKLIFTDPEGKKEIVEFTRGTVGFREANATHMVATPDKASMRVIEVEIK